MAPRSALLSFGIPDPDSDAVGKFGVGMKFVKKSSQDLCSADSGTATESKTSEKRMVH